METRLYVVYKGKTIQISEYINQIQKNSNFSKGIQKFATENSTKPGAKQQKKEKSVKLGSNFFSKIENRQNITKKLKNVILSIRGMKVTTSNKLFMNIIELQNIIYYISTEDTICYPTNVEWINLTFDNIINGIPTFSCPKNMKKELSAIKTIFYHPIRGNLLIFDEDDIMFNKYNRYLDVFNKFILIRSQFQECQDIMFHINPLIIEHCILNI